MPRDRRLYMTFPNDFWQHPKVIALPVEAKWAFVEMNGYSRMHDLDGLIPAAVAKRMWSEDVLNALHYSDPVKPLACWDALGEYWRLTDYAEHQQTKAEREELRRARSASGKAGAEARWGTRDGKPIASAMADGWQTDSRDQSPEFRDQTDDTYLGLSVQETLRARNAGLTDHGITSIIGAVEFHCDITATETEAVALAEHVLARATTAVAKPAAYVRRAVEANPTDIHSWLTQYRRKQLRAVNG